MDKHLDYIYGKTDELSKICKDLRGHGNRMGVVRMEALISAYQDMARRLERSKREELKKVEVEIYE